MGEIEILAHQHLLIIRAVIVLYGNAADEELADIVANDIAAHWNAPSVSLRVQRQWLDVIFDITGKHAPHLQPKDVIENTDPQINYFRVEDFAHGNISFVDGIGSNTGYFLKENLLNQSTTAAHEFGHTLGLLHPRQLDIRGHGVPGIMYPRGTLVDPEFQYDPSASAGANGGTLNPFKRKVLPSDVESLNIDTLDFTDGRAVIGDFTSVWHEAQVQL